MTRQELQSKLIEELKKVGFEIGNPLPNGHIPFKKDEVDLAFYIKDKAEDDLIIKFYFEYYVGIYVDKWLGNFGDDSVTFVKEFNGRKTYFDKELDMSVYATSQEEANKRFEGVRRMMEMSKKKYGVDIFKMKSAK